MAYEPTTELLSTDAQALDAAVLAAQVLIAAEVLGLPFDDETLSDEEWDRAVLAIALQVNYQVVLPPEVWALASISRGARSESYRGADRLPPAHAQAKVIADRIMRSSGWSVARRR
jgi:hypothetical protein